GQRAPGRASNTYGDSNNREFYEPAENRSSRPALHEPGEPPVRAARQGRGAATAGAVGTGDQRGGALAGALAARYRARDRDAREPLRHRGALEAGRLRG